MSAHDDGCCDLCGADGAALLLEGGEALQLCEECDDATAEEADRVADWLATYSLYCD